MSDRNHNEDLLRDIFAEEAPAEFRASLRDQTLRLVRRRRHFRQARVVALPLALILGFCLLSWRWLTPSGWHEHLQGYALVRTKPLPPGNWLETQPLQNESVVISTETPNLVTTAEAGYRTKQIDDEELLELAAPNPTVLIRHGPNQAELMIAGLTIGKE